MSKREKPMTKVKNQEQVSPEETINALIQKRKLQQEALKKIMTSIDKSENKDGSENAEVIEKNGAIQKLFNTKRKTK